MLIARYANGCHRDAKRAESPASPQHHNTREKEKGRNSKCVRRQSKEPIHLQQVTLLAVIHVLVGGRYSKQGFKGREKNADL